MDVQTHFQDLKSHGRDDLFTFYTSLYSSKRDLTETVIGCQMAGPFT